jgi:Raf kinase inhibitor-like YbhB/YbcL family protein
MLEKLPESVGHALENLRAGMEKILYHSVPLEHGEAQIQLVSPAFPPNSAMPVRFTSDGSGVSPPLQWANIPAETSMLALIVEDADAPTSEPLVHAIAVDIDPRLRGFDEGDFTAETENTPANLGRNSFFRQAWLPPDPPPGHGVHRYAFQIFALLPGDVFSNAPGRKELANAIRQRAIGSGCLIGTYHREQKVKVEEAQEDEATVAQSPLIGESVLA